MTLYLRKCFSSCMSRESNLIIYGIPEDLFVPKKQLRVKDENGVEKILNFRLGLLDPYALTCKNQVTGSPFANLYV